MAGQDEPGDLLLFAPVPLRRVTANGWTPERQRAFIAALLRMSDYNHVHHQRRLAMRVARYGSLEAAEAAAIARRAEVAEREAARQAERDRRSFERSQAEAARPRAGTPRPGPSIRSL